jgi:hypothetical protein
MKSIKTISSNILGAGFEIDSIQLINSATALAFSLNGKVAILHMSDSKGNKDVATIIDSPPIFSKPANGKIKCKLAKDGNNAICLIGNQILLINAINKIQVAAKCIEQIGISIDCYNQLIAVGFESGSVQVQF